MEIIELIAHDGSVVKYENKTRASGGVKDVFFDSDRSHAVCFYRKDIGQNGLDRLLTIVNNYRKSVFGKSGGKYWQTRILFPTKIVKNHKGKIGVVVPFYPSNYFFSGGSLAGKEKKLAWFIKPTPRKMLPPLEKGTLKKTLLVCIQIARIIKRLHAMGLAHSDLSCNNLLIDLQKGTVILIDNDGLVIPDKFPPDVLGTPEYIAPEVYKTINLKSTDPQKNKPNQKTDLHALAVIIYMLLFKRHPLIGQKVHHPNPATDNELLMGEKALFIEHPKDSSNRPIQEAKNQPWCNVEKLPHKIVGKQLAGLFERAFVQGLHKPNQRPIANEWEYTLNKTLDLLLPCGNPKCEEEWFVFTGHKKAQCPYCSWKLTGQLPILNFYSFNQKAKKYVSNHKQLIVYEGQHLYPWHIFSDVSQSELLEEQRQKPIGHFCRQKQKWHFIKMNHQLAHEISNGHTQLLKGKQITLYNGMKILFGKPPNGNLVLVQIVNF